MVVKQGVIMDDFNDVIELILKVVAEHHTRVAVLMVGVELHVIKELIGLHNDVVKPVVVLKVNHVELDIVVQLNDITRIGADEHQEEQELDEIVRQVDIVDMVNNEKA